jgi:DNA-binding NarL/FixJ family response regulator
MEDRRRWPIFLLVKVFIVDDSEILCARLRTLISGIEGVKVQECAYHVAGAIAALRRLAGCNAAPDVMILDMRLTDGSGIDVLKEARKCCPRTKVMVLTNYLDGQYRRICAEEGADFFLDKSMEFEQVGLLLRRMSGRCNGAAHA